ncbi:hypothetical protein VNO77_15988 [Canavalia gladiata]|uniref:Uncharacterized protein n=1 Tax=Canavalia gladiata TaxID=3824 RepID=A0AAN9M3B9_CANGL
MLYISFDYCNTVKCGFEGIYGIQVIQQLNNTRNLKIMREPRGWSRLMNFVTECERTSNPNRNPICRRGGIGIFLNLMKSIRFR